MPSHRCVVDIDAQAVSAPGVWLPNKENVYLSVSMFGKTQNSRLLTSIFPMLVDEHFIFEKVFYTTVDRAHVVDMLRDELVTFELLQLSRYTDAVVKLASYTTSAKEFLFPYTVWSSAYVTNRKDIVMSRTLAYSGLCPKLEASTKTWIEVEAPFVDPLPEPRRVYLPEPRRVYVNPVPEYRHMYDDSYLDREIELLAPAPPSYRQVRPQTAIGTVPRRPWYQRPVSPPVYRRPVSPVLVRRPISPHLCRRPVSPVLVRRPISPVLCRRPVSPVLSRPTVYRDPLLYRPYTPTYLDRLEELEQERARANRISSAYRSYSKSIEDLTQGLTQTRVRRY